MATQHTTGAAAWNAGVETPLGFHETAYAHAQGQRGRQNVDHRDAHSTYVDTRNVEGDLASSELHQTQQCTGTPGLAAHTLAVGASRGVNYLEAAPFVGNVMCNTFPKQQARAERAAQIVSVAARELSPADVAALPASAALADPTGLAPTGIDAVHRSQFNPRGATRGADGRHVGRIRPSMKHGAAKGAIAGAALSHSDARVTRFALSGTPVGEAAASPSARRVAGAGRDPTAADLVDHSLGRHANAGQMTYHSRNMDPVTHAAWRDRLAAPPLEAERYGRKAATHSPIMGAVSGCPSGSLNCPYTYRTLHQ